MSDGSSTIHWPSNADFEFDGSHDDFAAYLNLDLSQFDAPSNGISTGFEKQNFPTNGHGDAMDLDTFQIQQQQQHHHHHHHHHVQQHQHQHQQPQQQQQQQHNLNNHGVSDMDVLAFGDFSLQANQQQQHQQQQQTIQQVQGIKSVTPSNIVVRQNDQQTFRHRSSMHSNRSLEFNNTFRDDPSQYTPLVSPAVTPLETQFAHMPEIPDYGMNPAYFSPLTSPALEAYPDSGYPDSTYSASSQASMRTSPVEVEPQGRPSKKPSSTNGSISGSGSGRKKSVSKPSSSSSNARPVRESPNLKPKSRKKSTPALIPTPELTSQLERMTTSSSSSIHRFSLGPPSDALQPNYNYNDGSGGSNSISPEPSSEMPPPPPPDRSRRNSLVRSMDPRKSSAPATPASLMKLANSDMPLETGPTGSVLEKPDPTYLKELAAVPKTHSDDEQTTPTLASTRANGTTSANSNSSSSKTKKRPAPSSRKNSYSKPPAPQLEKAASRTKSSSTAPSPALLPRISPAIMPKLAPSPSPSLQPLLPNPMNSTAILLSQKSNYQNIIEGNHTQLGLSYPEELSTTLTSKRTSHKLAEQIRRDRLNSAIDELRTLLPEDEDAANASKAATVEKASGFIRNLRKEHDKLRRTLEKLKLKGIMIDEDDADDGEEIPHHEEEVPAKRKKTICQKEKDKNEEAKKREKEESPSAGPGTGPSSKSGTPSSSRPVSMVITS